MVTHKEAFEDIAIAHYKASDGAITPYDAIVYTLAHYPKASVRAVIKERGRIRRIAFVDDSGILMLPDITSEAKPNANRTNTRRMR